MGGQQLLVLADVEAAIVEPLVIYGVQVRAEGDRTAAVPPTAATQLERPLRPRCARKSRSCLYRPHLYYSARPQSDGQDPAADPSAGTTQLHRQFGYPVCRTAHRRPTPSGRDPLVLPLFGWARLAIYRAFLHIINTQYTGARPCPPSPSAGPLGRPMWPVPSSACCRSRHHPDRK